VIRNGEREADAKSLISLLGLAVRPSSEITVAAEGCDADEALAILAAELSPYVTQSGGFKREKHDVLTDSVTKADR
jgi:phosphotransferase system HPr-like phosphotransfer protein